MNEDRKVSWEVQTGTSKASLSRLMHALILCDAELRSHYVMTSSWPKVGPGELSPHGTLIAIVRLAPENLDRFKALAKPFRVLYRSPTWFDHGSIRGVHKDPESEITTRSEEALRHQAGVFNEVVLTFVAGADSDDFPKKPLVAIARVLYRDKKNVLQTVSEIRKEKAGLEVSPKTYQDLFREVFQDVFEETKVWLDRKMASKD